MRDWLRRHRGVPKSAFASPGKRPSPKDHLETIEVSIKPQILQPTRITVLDDVITRGATLLACVIRLRKSLPNVEVRGFAVARTKKENRKFENVVERVEDGKITLAPNGWITREP